MSARTLTRPPVAHPHPTSRTLHARCTKRLASLPFPETE
jgi:hypothetical protein